MDLKERALAGVIGGVAATLVLSGLREAWTRLGLVFETAPQQVVDRAWRKLGSWKAGRLERGVS